ncbi:carboxypeptidase-like regulatory domain-containing protein [Gemmatimonadota bacterium]
MSLKKICRHGATATVFILVTVAILPSPLQGQALRGRVVDDSTNVALGDVTITLMQGQVVLRRMISDSLGSFFFALPDSGAYGLEAQRLGYETARGDAVRVPGTDTVSVEFRIRMGAILLEPLIISARTGYGSTQFNLRMQNWRRGVFMTPEMVDSLNPRHPADVFRGQERTWVSWEPGNRNLVPAVRSFLGSGCVSYMLNELPIRPREGGFWEDSPLEFVTGEDIVAVEYYRYIGEVPPNLRAKADVGVGDQICGLVIFWTEEGW